MIKLFRPDLFEYQLEFIVEILRLNLEMAAARPLPGMIATQEQVFEQQRISCAYLRIESEFVREHGLSGLSKLRYYLAGVLMGPVPEALHQPGPGPRSRDVSGEADGLRAPDPAVQADGAAQ